MKRLYKATFATAILMIAVSGAAAQPHAQSTPSNPSVAPKTTEIVFGPPRNYQHKSGWFSLSIPTNWTVSDKSDDSEAILSLADPTENAIVVVRAYRPGKQYSEAELGALLKAFVNERLGSFDAFSMGELKSQPDGSLGLYFQYDSVVNGVKYKMRGDAFIEQHNGLLAVVTLIMPQDQFDQKKKPAYELINSFRFTGRSP